MSGATIRLQGIGLVAARPAREVEAGDTLVWNYGYRYEVVSVDPSPSGRTLTVVERDPATGREVHATPRRRPPSRGPEGGPAVRVRVAYTTEVDDEYRAAIAHNAGEHGRLATRKEVRDHLWLVGSSEDDDLMWDFQNCDAGCNTREEVV